MSASIEQPTPPRPPVSIKGRGRDIRVVVEDASDASAAEQSLRDQLQRRSGAFFTGVPVTLEMPGSAIDFALAGRLAAAIVDAGMHVSAVSASTAVDGGAGKGARRNRASTELSAGSRGGAGRGAGGSGSGGGGGDGEAGGGVAAGAMGAGEGAYWGASAPANANTGMKSAALVVERTLRGGQRLEHDGDVIVIGDVNPGAELVAGGSVVVWGRLRGTVEAGAGSQGAFVCALDLAPSQLLIGTAIARAPDDPSRNPAPEIAREVDGRIEVEDWR